MLESNVTDPLRGFFITGTDTGVGKTVVTAGLLRGLRARGIDAIPMKPVQTGALSTPDGLRAPDLEFCLSAAGICPSPDERALMAPYLYEPACSPHLAGRLCGRYADIGWVRECARRLGRAHECLLVEGAGGVMAPLDDERTMLALMRALGLPVLLVARATLGTINHTLLSLGALRETGLRVLGVVVNHVVEAARDFIIEDNLKAIAQFGGLPVLGEVRHMKRVAAGGGSTEAWRAFESDMIGLRVILNELKDR